MSKINFFVVGAGKSATTWLYEGLQQHPEVSVAPEKETHFFCPIDCEKNKLSFSKDWYEKKFRGDKKVRVDLTVDYSYYHSYTAPLIHEYNADAKIIFILRNPIDRFYSDYWMHKRNDSSLPSIIDLPSDHEFFERGRYFSQISSFIECFGTENVGLFYYDDLLVSPEDFISSIYLFMGVKNDFKPNTVYEKIATTHKFKSETTRKLYKISGSLMKKKLVLKLWRFIKTKTNIKDVIVNNTKIVAKYPEMSTDERAYLSQIYTKENNLLFEMTGRSISSWLPSNSST